MSRAYSVSKLSASGTNKFKMSSGSTSASTTALKKKKREKDGSVTETEEREGNIKSTRCYRSIMVTCHLARKSAECKVVFLGTGQDRQVVVAQGEKYSGRKNVLISRSVTRLPLLLDKQSDFAFRGSVFYSRHLSQTRSGCLHKS